MTRNWFESLFLSIKGQVAWGIIALVLAIAMYFYNRPLWISYFAFWSAWGFRGAWDEYISKQEQTHER